MEIESPRDLVRHRAGEHPRAVAAHRPDGAPVTFAELQDRVDELRDRLPASARRVAVVVPNSIDGVAALHAAWQRGATAVLVGSAVPEAEAVRRAGETACEVLLDPRHTGDPLRFSPEEPETVDGEAVVVFTSGTSGRPKAAVLTFSALSGSMASIAEGAGLDPAGRPPTDPPRSVTPVFVSLGHVGGLIATVNSMHQGKPFVIFDKFRVAEVFEIVERFRLRLLRLTPAMVFDLAHWPDDRSLDTVRSVTVGSAALDDRTRELFEERYGAFVLQSYGQTEFAGAIAFERYDDVRAGRRPEGTVGRLAPRVEVKIVGADGAEQPPGGVGEILARSASTFAAYIQDGRLVDPKDGGWHATGDLGRLDADGFLAVVGRADDTIICGGFNVYPAMVESALARLDGVAGSLVVGLPDERLGEIPVAVVVPEPGVGLEPEAVRERLRPELAAYEIPRRVVVAGELPMTAGGKPDRDAARALFGTPAPRPA